MKKVFYIFPPILVCINFVSLLLLGIIFVRTELDLWDYISIAVGGVLTIIFALSLISTHKFAQSHMEPDKVDKLITNGPYSLVRHPSYSGTILMNIAYLFFFRTLWLVPLICVFSALWYLEARHEEKALVARFGESYKSYIKTTGMFFPKLSRPKA